MAEPVDYQAVLADLKSRRARLDVLIGGIEATIMGQGDGSFVTPDLEFSTSSGVPLGPAEIHPDTFYGLSIIAAVKKYLKLARRAQHTKAIADALSQGGLKRPADNVLSGILIRAAKGREVTKVGKGTWGLSEWYPRPPKEVKEPMNGRRKRPGRPRKVRLSSAKRDEPKKKTEPQAEARIPGKTTGRPSDIALEVMRAAGKPLHAVEITRLVNERGIVALRLPIESFLNRQVKAGKMRKIGPSIFALAS